MPLLITSRNAHSPAIRIGYQDGAMMVAARGQGQEKRSAKPHLGCF
ncbi:hypothetical protein [Pseudomonas sp. NFX224]